MALRDNLVSWWELNETSGTRVDAHGANNLSDNNTVLYATGKQGNAGDFEATNSEYLSIADASQSGLDLTTTLSLSVWVYLESQPATNGTEVICGKDGNNTTGRSYSLFYRDVGGTKMLTLFVDKNGGVNASDYDFLNHNVTLSNATWYHVVVTWDGATKTAKFYIDGTNVSSPTGTNVGTLHNSSEPFGIGAYYAGASWGGFMDGLIDEVGLWARVLTGAEVTTIYNSGSGLNYAGTSPATNVTVSPSAQVATLTVPTYTPKHGSSLFPSAQVATFSVPAYTVSMPKTISATVGTATFSIPLYNAGGNKVLYPSAQALTFSIPAYQLLTYNFLTPNGQVLTFTLPANTVTTTANITITPTTIVLTFVTPSRAKVGAVWVKRGRSTNATWVKSTRNSN